MPADGTLFALALSLSASLGASLHTGSLSRPICVRYCVAVLNRDPACSADGQVLGTGLIASKHKM